MSKKSKPGDGSHGKGKKGGGRDDSEDEDGGGEESFVERIFSFFKSLF